MEVVEDALEVFQDAIHNSADVATHHASHEPSPHTTMHIQLQETSTLMHPSTYPLAGKPGAQASGSRLD